MGWNLQSFSWISVLTWSAMQQRKHLFKFCVLLNSLRFFWLFSLHKLILSRRFAVAVNCIIPNNRMCTCGWQWSLCTSSDWIEVLKEQAEVWFLCDQWVNFLVEGAYSFIGRNLSRKARTISVHSPTALPLVSGTHTAKFSLSLLQEPHRGWRWVCVLFPLTVH